MTALSERNFYLLTLIHNVLRFSLCYNYSILRNRNRLLDLPCYSVIGYTDTAHLRLLLASSQPINGDDKPYGAADSPHLLRALSFLHLQKSSIILRLSYVSS